MLFVNSNGVVLKIHFAEDEEYFQWNEQIFMPTLLQQQQQHLQQQQQQQQQQDHDHRVDEVKQPICQSGKKFLQNIFFAYFEEEKKLFLKKKLDKKARTKKNCFPDRKLLQMINFRAFDL